MNEIKEHTEKMFEDIKHIDEVGNEYWLARELQVALEYKRWDKFCKVIENAKITRKKSKYAVSYHFYHLGKMVDIGSGAKIKKLKI